MSLAPPGVGAFPANTSPTGGNWTWENTTLPAYQPYRPDWSGEILFRIVTTILVMVVTLAGNSVLILMIMCHRKQRRKRVNIFLVNLAVGDLMVCFFTMSSEILFVAFGEWVMGAAACKLVVYGQMVTLASATFLLTGMAIDRYQVIVQPLQSFAGHPKIWRKVLTAWILAFIFASPQLLIFVQTDSVQPSGRVKYMCRSQGYTAPWQRKTYFTYLATYILLVPTIIMSYCYMNIIRVVWSRTDSKSHKPKRRVQFPVFRRRSSADSGSGVSLHRADRFYKRRSAVTQNKLSIPKKLASSSKRNVVKMTLSVIIGFLLCWTPYFVVSLIRIYSNYQIKLKVGLAVAEIMALVHSAMNPILYGIFSTKALKAGLMRMCRCAYRGRSLDRIDEGMSEDETTWTEVRIGTVPVEAVRGGCCQQAWLSLWYKVKGGNGRRGQGNRRGSTYYLELVPNGSLAAAQRRKSTQSQILETDLSDTDQPQEASSSSCQHLQLPPAPRPHPHPQQRALPLPAGRQPDVQMVEYVSSSL